MTMSINPLPWTPEQIDAALTLAVEHHAPAWAEKLFLTMLAARDAAPEGHAETWANTARDTFMQEVGTVGDRMAAYAGASPERTAAFAHEVHAVMAARFAELTAGGTTQGGRA